MKTGRNDPCPCGSGKKFKKCCLNKTVRASVPASQPTPQMPKHIQHRIQHHNAAERIRRQQQGHGRPIVSWQDPRTGYRFVGVKATVYTGKNWVLFPDFLLHFLKDTMTLEWGAREAHGRHALFRWLEKTKAYCAPQAGAPKVREITLMGFMACWTRLAYALYLIAHHDILPKTLLKRLRDANTFLPAYHETVVGAALAVAGFDITSAEVRASSAPTPEFRATSKLTKKTYEVEAKRKKDWKTSTADVTDPAFQSELATYIRNQLHNASAKKLSNPIYWFELSIPTVHSEDEWRTIAAVVETAVRNAERDMTVDGEPIWPAYVIVSNHIFIVNEDIEGQPAFAVLETIKMPDFPFRTSGGLVEIETVLDGYDAHRDIVAVMEGFRTSCTVPTTFDGTPPELLNPDGTSQPPLKIGDDIEVPNTAGNIVRGVVEEIASMGNGFAMVVVNVSGARMVVKLPLTAGEAKAAERFTDAVFGKDNPGRRLKDNDMFALYDWLIDSYATATRDQLDKQFDQCPETQHFKALPIKEARIQLARQYLKSMWPTMQKKL